MTDTDPPSAIDRDRIVDTLCRLAGEQVGVDRAEVHLETNLYQDLNFDSLDIVEYSMKIEDAFGITVPDEAAGRIQTVRDAVDALIELLEHPAPARQQASQNGGSSHGA